MLSFSTNRGDLLKKNLLDLTASPLFTIILDVDSREKRKFDVLHREPEAHGTLFLLSKFTVCSKIEIFFAKSKNLINKKCPRPPHLGGSSV